MEAVVTARTGKRCTYRIGFDIGGTFTDLVMTDSEGQFVGSLKALTTPKNLSEGAVHGIRALLEQHGVEPHQVVFLMHATTQTSNLLVERNGASVALVTTLGFRDILEFANESRYELYDLMLQPFVPLVPRNSRFEVRERLSAQGGVLEPVDEQSAIALGRQLQLAGYEAAAVILLHSYLNPSHERQVAHLLRRGGFTREIVLSSVVCPEIREYPRSATTVCNAYLAPKVSHYLQELSQRIKEQGFSASVNLMSSSGGCISAATAIRRPVELLECGAAAGVLSAARVARGLSIPRALSLEMGGTTAKSAIVLNGQPALARAYEVARAARFKKGSGMPVQSSAVDLIEIGAGGGSIAEVDMLGMIRVGPQSANSDPGPACYGRGGDRPTVTDADLVLGYLNPAGLLGGDFPLYRQLAVAAINDHVATPLGISAEEAAAAIHSIVVENMAAAVRIHVIEHGLDPREFTMIASGGAGPVHAAAIAARLGLTRLVIMPNAGLGAAVGLLCAPPLAVVARAMLCPLDALDWANVAMVFDGMRLEALSDLNGCEAGELECNLYCDMRYRGQGHEITVPFSSPPFDLHSGDALSAAFNHKYREHYGRNNEGAAVEVVSWRIVVHGPERETTTVVPAGAQVQLDLVGNLCIHLSEEHR